MLIIKEKYIILFSFELGERVLENSTNSGKTLGKLKHKTTANTVLVT